MSLDSRFRDVNLPFARALGFSTGALADGERLARRDRVLDLTPTDDGGVTARVRGAGVAPYEITATGESPAEFASSCTCPFGEGCQHVAAVLFATEEVTAGWRGRGAAIGKRPLGSGKRSVGSDSVDDDLVIDEAAARPRRTPGSAKPPTPSWMPPAPTAPMRPPPSPPVATPSAPIPTPPPTWPTVLDAPSSGEATPMRLGFRVTPTGHGAGERVAVELVRWSERGVARVAELPDTDDLQSRAVALLLALGTDAALGAALDLLADHPHVFVGARRARVLRQALSVQIVAESGAAQEPGNAAGAALSLALAVGTEVFAAGELPARLIGGVVVRVEAGDVDSELAPMVLIAPVRAPAEALLGRLASAPALAPASVLPRLVEVLRAVGLEPDVETLLAPRQPCQRAVTIVRLEWRKPSLELAIGHVLHPDYPMLAPGEGPPVLYVRDDLLEAAPERGTIRVVALERDLAGERDAARQIERRFGLSLGPGFRLRATGDEALALMKRLAAVGPDGGIRIEWATGKPAFGEVTPKDLQIGSGDGAGSTRWLFLGGRVRHDGGSIPLDLLLRAIADRQRFVEVNGDGSAWLELEEGLRAQLAALASLAGVDGGLSPLAAPLLADLEGSGATLPEAMRAGLERVRSAGVVPDGLVATLRPYQDEGIRWLTQLSGWAPGAVLADDMGLGKTLQAIALLLHRREKGPALVVAPTSVTFNWLREIPRFGPALSPQAFRAWRDAGSKAQPGLVVVIGWESMAIHAAHLTAVPWATVIFDEAQALKNQATRRTQAARALPAGFKLALTGTPVENRLSELWSLMDVVVPGLLDGHRERGDSGPDAISALARAIRPFVLRRLKRDVAKDLPPRTDVLIDIELSEPERAEYDRIRGAAIAQVTARAAEPRDKGDDGAEERRAQALVLSALLRLRQAACHPRLLDPGSALPSAKLDALEGLVTTLAAAGHRALVFSQFASLLRLVREHLEGLGLNVRHLDGSTPTAERRRQVDAFQAGDGDVFLISLQAGGTGLNLTAADYVVHLDPWWNPAIEDQATGRAHRIGQTRPVTVYRLIARGTVEDAIAALHDKKRALLEGLLEGADAPAELTAGDLMAILAG